MKFSIGHTTIHFTANRFHNADKGEKGYCFGYAISVQRSGDDSSFDTIHNSARLIRFIRYGSRMRVQVMNRKQRLQKMM